METQLISASEFLPYADICSNIETARRIDPHVMHAQRVELKPLLGDRLYFDLVENIGAYRALIELNPAAVATPEQQAFIDLLNGVKYTHEGSVKSYLGLRPVLVYFAYKRFVSKDNIKSTVGGFVIKATLESTVISGKQLAEEAARAENDALVYFSDVKSYMRDFNSFYSKYQSTCDNRVNKRLNGFSSARNKNKLSGGYR